MKCNNAKDGGTGLAYTLREAPECDSAVLAWEPEPIRITADEAMSSSRDDRVTGRDEAEEWLADALAGGPLAAVEIKARAADDGIAERTLSRAKKRLAIVSERVGFGADGEWTWRLPEHHTLPKDAIHCQSERWQPMATYGEVGTLCERNGHAGGLPI